MFQVIGDEVFFDGYAVASLRGAMPASVREKVEGALNGTTYVARDDFESLQADLAQSEGESERLAADVEAADEKITDLEEAKIGLEVKIEGIAEILEDPLEDATGVLIRIREILLGDGA